MYSVYYLKRFGRTDISATLGERKTSKIFCALIHAILQCYAHSTLHTIFLGVICRPRLQTDGVTPYIREAICTPIKHLHIFTSLCRTHTHVLWALSKDIMVLYCIFSPKPTHHTKLLAFFFFSFKNIT